MVKMRDRFGTLHIVAHTRRSDIATLIAIQQKFGGTLALWSTNFKCWIAMTDMDLGSAEDTEIEVMSRAG